MEQNNLAETVEKVSFLLSLIGGKTRSGTGLGDGLSAGGGSYFDNGDVERLTPKHYYELHIRVMEELPNLEEYFLSRCGRIITGETTATGVEVTTLKDLYRVVQFCPNVLPRLYLQTRVGSAILRESKREMGEDLLEVAEDCERYEGMGYNNCGAIGLGTIKEEEYSEREGYIKGTNSIMTSGELIRDLGECVNASSVLFVGCS